ncbi:toll/interleukin-1 receptor domain-containing protein [Aquidulcibacter sp.]|uniref:toll/interleukin-1 receptor domain-containing protein n=1 Tax=Aquidulcibacter sp. TaxID=2052990 RepID=UPI0025BB6F11|nr:toll/interleukin-1 receptor domain-containing protein [Aquidulcibacter sp.]MCA3692134.1 toll/interleukin-1 receptor domain-containing protein [Aquidulcibacter sp.]
MKVFISWSGSRSKDLANALHGWLPMVLQYVTPFVSEKDISAGDRWAQTIAGELEAANFGIICITPENKNSEWILFEAGALSKSIMEGKVIPLLLGLELSDLSGPLSQFQAQKVEEGGLLEIVRAINKVAENRANPQIVEQLVPTVWPRLKEDLDKIPDKVQPHKQKRNQDEILEELVSGVRGISLRMRDISGDGSDREGMIRRRRSRFHPFAAREISLLLNESDEGPFVLLFFASYFRDELPWLAELIAETYRETRSGTIDQVQTSLARLRHLSKQYAFHPALRELYPLSKDTHLALEELQMFLDIRGPSIMEREARLLRNRARPQDE